MTIHVNDIANAIMNTNRGRLKPGTVKPTMRQALLDAGINEEEHSAFFAIVLGRGTYWERKAIQENHPPGLVIVAAFADGLLIGLETRADN